MSDKISPDNQLDRKILRPAFESNAEAWCFLALVVLALALPVLITESGLISRQNSYEIMPENQGAFSFVKNETFENTEDIDILFVGSSVTFGSIDAPQIQQALSGVLGRPARVMTFGHYFNTVDIAYMQIRDLLERKRVRQIVFSIPRVPYTEGPSPTAYKFIRYSDDGELFDKLSLKSKISLYACTVLRSPHDLLTIIRPNLSKPSPFAENLGADKANLGMGRDIDKFVRFTPTSPSISGRELIYAPETQERFHFTDEEITNHQNLYLEKLIELLERKNVPLMIINIPQYTEIHNTKIVELKDWSKHFGKPIPIVGVPPTVLFAGLSDKEIESLYYDEIHFNANGNEFFTRTILPAILEIYEKNETKNY